MLNKIKSLVILLFSLFLLPHLTQAQNIDAKLKKITSEADVILTGKVIKQTHSWGKSKSKIYTFVTIEVDDYIKGNQTEKTLIVRHPGGEVDGIGELYSHMPKFRDDEEILLFAEKERGSSTYKVVQGEEGKITIYPDKKKGNKTTLFNKNLEAFKKEIKSYVEKK